MTDRIDQKTEPPLTGLRIIEFAGIGPGPFAAMMLADMGAEVIRIDRTGSPETPNDFMLRGRRSIALNLKDPQASGIAMRLIETADGLIEGFRPGVMERLGLGPDACFERNPRLVYGRMTGWGQDGPLAHAAGHDLNYIALTGALWGTGEPDRAPTFPMNLLGDFGGGGMYLAFGMLAGILNAKRTGQGDIVDAAICDGTNSLMTFIQARRAMGEWGNERGVNLLDGGVPWYAVYECSDGKWISVGALEPQFWTCLLDKLQLNDIGDRTDPRTWDETRQRLSQTFAAHPQEHWIDLLEGTDACFAPVLSPAEARHHSHMASRNAFLPGTFDEPAPAPRFANAQTQGRMPSPVPGEHTSEILAEIGFEAAEIEELIASAGIGT